MLQTCDMNLLLSGMPILSATDHTSCMDNDAFDNQAFRRIEQGLLSLASSPFYSERPDKTERVNFADHTRRTGIASIVFFVFCSVTLLASSVMALTSSDILPIIPYMLSVASAFYVIAFPMGMFASALRAKAFNAGEVVIKIFSLFNKTYDLDAGAILLVIVGPLLAIMTVMYWLLKRKVWDMEASAAGMDYNYNAGVKPQYIPRQSRMPMNPEWVFFLKPDVTL